MMNWKRLAGTLKMLSEMLMIVRFMLILVLSVFNTYEFFLLYRCSRRSVDEVLAQSCERKKWTGQEDS